MKILYQKLYFFLRSIPLKKYKKAEPVPEQPRKILLIMCKWMGDTFWDIQGIPALQNQFPQAEIHVLIKPFSRFLFRGLLPETQIHVSSQITSDCRRESFSTAQWKKDLAEIRALNADLLIDFTETPFSAVFAALSGANYLIGYDHLRKFSRLYHRTCHAEYGLHLSRRPMQLYLPLLKKELPFPQFVPAAETPACPGPDVIIFPSAGWKSKEYPPEKYHIVAKALTEQGYSVCLAGAPKENTLCEEIAAGLKNTKILTGPPGEMLNHLVSAKVCLSGDTGPAHLAAAMGKFTVTMFCGTNPDFCGPLGNQVRLLCSSCPDRPAGSVQFCPADRGISCTRSCCMEIPPETVIAEIAAYLKSEKRQP